MESRFLTYRPTRLTCRPTRLDDKYIVLRAEVPPEKVGPVIGTGGKVIKQFDEEYNCCLAVVHRSEEKPTAIIIGKGTDLDGKETSHTNKIEAFSRLCRIITSPQGPDNGSDTVLRIIARIHHLTDFSLIAENFGTTIQIKGEFQRQQFQQACFFGVSSMEMSEDLRVASLLEDRIIEVIGQRKDVLMTGSKLAEYLCEYQFDSSIISLFCSEPKRLFKTISPLIESWNIRVSADYIIPVETAIAIINADTEVVSAVTKDTSNFLIIEVLGKRRQVDQASQFLQKVIGDASLNDENVF